MTIASSTCLTGKAAPPKPARSRTRPSSHSPFRSTSAESGTSDLVLSHKDTLHQRIATESPPAKRSQSASATLRTDDPSATPSGDPEAGAGPKPSRASGSREMTPQSGESSGAHSACGGSPSSISPRASGDTSPQTSPPKPSVGVKTRVQDLEKRYEARTEAIKTQAERHVTHIERSAEALFPSF